MYRRICIPICKCILKLNINNIIIKLISNAIKSVHIIYIIIRHEKKNKTCKRAKQIYSKINVISLLIRKNWIKKGKKKCAKINKN